MGFVLEIVTPKGTYLRKEIDSLNVKLTSGYRTFLKGHYPLVGSLSYGPMHIICNGEITYYALHGGAINVTKEKIVLICNAIELASDIDVARAKLAKERAEQRIASNNPDIDLKRAQLALERAITRIRVADSI